MILFKKVNSEDDNRSLFNDIKNNNNNHANKDCVIVEFNKIIHMCEPHVYSIIVNTPLYRTHIYLILVCCRIPEQVVLFVQLHDKTQDTRRLSTG